MDDPVVIWPPDGGNYDDYNGDSMTSVCQSWVGYNYVDCTGGYDAAYGYEIGDGLVCCPVA